MIQKVLAILLLASAYAYAFIDIAPQNIGDKKGPEGEVSLGAKYSSGNTENRLLSFSAKGQYDSADWLTFIIASYSYGEAKGDVNSNEGLLHWRYIHSIDATLFDWEVFLQGEFNKFQKIEHRDLAGGGIRRRFPGYFDSFYIGLGLFYSYMEPKEITAIDRKKERIKANSYISFKKTFNKDFFVTYLGYYQPNIEEVSDFSSFQLMQFNTPLSDALLLSLNLLYRYNSTPYSGIEKDDFTMTVSLNYSF